MMTYYGPPDTWNPPEPEIYLEPEDDYDDHRDREEDLRREAAWVEK